MDHGLRTTDHGPRTTDDGLRTPGCEATQRRNNPILLFFSQFREDRRRRHFTACTLGLGEVALAVREMGKALLQVTGR